MDIKKAKAVKFVDEKWGVAIFETDWKGNPCMPTAQKESFFGTVELLMSSLLMKQLSLRLFAKNGQRSLGPLQSGIE